MCLCQLSLYFGFVLQVLLQVLIILSGNYNFFNLLTLTLCLSLLDDQHVHFWLRKRSIGSNSGMNKNTSLAFAGVTSHFYPFSLQARPLGRGSVTCWSWWSGLSWLQELFCASTCSWIRLKWPSPPGRVRSCATIKIETCIKTLRFKLMVPVCLYGVLSSIHLPPVQPVYEDRHHSLCLDRCPLSHLGVDLLHVQVGLFSVCWWSTGEKGVTVFCVIAGAPASRGSWRGSAGPSSGPCLQLPQLPCSPSVWWVIVMLRSTNHFMVINLFFSPPGALHLCRLWL